jgi:hypothetical protein
MLRIGYRKAPGEGLQPLDPVRAAIIAICKQISPDPPRADYCGCNTCLGS